MPDLITRRAPLSTFDRDARTVEAILSSGADVERRDARGSYIERLELRSATLPARVPLLDFHRRDTIRAVLGYALPRIEGAEVRATLHVTDEHALALIDSGAIDATSIGYLPAAESWRTTEGGGRIRTVTPVIHEASLVLFPADDRAAILRTDPMETTAETNAAIRSLVRAAELPAAFADSLIDEGATLERAQSAAFVELTSRTRLPAMYRTTTEDELPAMRERMAAALAARLGVPGELTGEAVQYRGLSLHEMGRTLLAARGERVLSLPPEQLLLRMTTTGELTPLLVDGGTRRLMAAHVAAASPVKQLGRQSTADDFRAKTGLRIGTSGLLERVAEAGEIRHGAFVETKETYKLETFAKIWSLTRQALINDDLGAFGDMSAMMGRNAAETEARVLVDLLTANAGLGPTMDDGNTLYDGPTHGNESATGTTIDADALSDGVLAMRTQTGVTGEPINAVPSYLLVSPQMEFVARQAVSAYYPATAANTNPLAGSLAVLVEPRLTGTRWYLFADPAVLPALEYSYLSSAPGPQMQSREGFDVLGMEFRVVLDYGAGVLDWRGTYTNAGA